MTVYCKINPLHNHHHHLYYYYIRISQEPRELRGISFKLKVSCSSSFIFLPISFISSAPPPLPLLTSFCFTLSCWCLIFFFCREMFTCSTKIQFDPSLNPLEEEVGWVENWRNQVTETWSELQVIYTRIYRVTSSCTVVSIPEVTHAFICDWKPTNYFKRPNVVQRGVITAYLGWNYTHIQKTNPKVSSANGFSGIHYFNCAKYRYIF